MLFMITQTHTPESCPKGVGTADSLVDMDAEGVTVQGRWGAWSRHTVWYLVEADSLEPLQRFVDPGMTRTTCTIDPVGGAPIIA